MPATNSYVSLALTYFNLFFVLFTDIDYCINHTCQNGGSCVDGIHSYSCKCPTGYTGGNCETGKFFLFCCYDLVQFTELILFDYLYFVLFCFVLVHFILTLFSLLFFFVRKPNLSLVIKPTRHEKHSIQTCLLDNHVLIMTSPCEKVRNLGSAILDFKNVYEISLN